jgi:CRP-like cAMP-binding protein
MVTRAEFQGENQLLTALSASDYSLLRPHLKEVRLEQGSVLQDHGERIQYVHFPVSGMISLLSVMRDGKGVETVVVGREGVLGAHCAFGIWQAYSRAVVQISGRAARIAGAQFQKAVRESERMGDLFLRYRELRLAQTQQSAACNALHGAESRLSRWLLQTSDVIGADMVPLTQEFLSQMLGVRRTTVTAIARTLQETGMIRYTRGRIEISDREKLEASACEYHEVLRRQPAQILFRPKR